LFDYRWIGQMDPIAMFLQPIDKPVPVVGGFNDNTFQIRLEWL